jgi:hypothetical protein
MSTTKHTAMEDAYLTAEDVLEVYASEAIDLSREDAAYKGCELNCVGFATRDAALDACLQSARELRAAWEEAS